MPPSAQAPLAKTLSAAKRKECRITAPSKKVNRRYQNCRRAFSAA
jgi:hypothetical protein